MFSAYFKLGIDHILDPSGYDHILFVAVLCALYAIRDWKKVLLMVTAFTVGHTATLALSSLDVVSLDPTIVERLIPLTIIATALSNIYQPGRIYDGRSSVTSYLITVMFGLIHGLGFSNYFKALINPEESIVLPLFAFNCGVEAGQIVIVFCVMLSCWIVTDACGLPRKWWTVSLSSAGLAIAVYLLTDR